jgi:hypothetical protein
MDDHNIDCEETDQMPLESVDDLNLLQAAHTSTIDDSDVIQVGNI